MSGPERQDAAPPPRPDRGLVNQLVAAGVDQDAAGDMVAKVFAAMLAQLVDGKAFSLPGIGKLSAPWKARFVPGSRNRRAVMQRRVKLSYPTAIVQGEPYDVA